MSESGYDGDLNNHEPAFTISNGRHRPISPRNLNGTRLVEKKNDHDHFVCTSNVTVYGSVLDLFSNKYL